MEHKVLLRSANFAPVFKQLLTALCAALLLLTLINQSSAAPLSGNYTINSAVATGGGNFQTFQALADSLRINGISGNVTATVTPGSGPYTEQVVFTAVAGAGPSARITIDGSGETLTAVTVGTKRYVLRIANAAYYNVSNLKIVMGAGSAGGFYGIHLFGNCNNMTISNCEVDMTGGITNTLFGGYILSGDTSSILTGGSFQNITIDNNVSTGGGYGVSVYGTPGAGLTNGVVVSNNTLTQISSNAIYLNNNYGTIVRGNTVNITANGNGIQVAGANNGNVLVEKNIVSATNTLATQTFTGIYVFGNSPASSNKVINNLIWNMNVTKGNVVGLKSREGGEFYFNTVILNDTTATGNVAYGFEEELSNSGSILKNNIFYITRTSANYGAAIALASSSNATSAVISDYNVVYLEDTNAYAVKKGITTTNPPNAAYMTLTDWQLASTQDSNSFQANPFFASAVLARPTNGIINNQGTPIAGVTDDITGTPGDRATTPDPGAYEFSPAVDDAAITGFAPPSFPFCGTSLNVQFVLANAGGSTLNSVTIDWSVNGVAQTAVNLTNLGLAAASDTVIALGTITVASNTLYNFTATSSNPNGVTDINTVNDSYTETGWRTGFTGTLTINDSIAPAPYVYNTFQPAADDLELYGVCGPVTVNVVGAGPYTEQVIFSPVPGASLTNTITVNGNSRILQYNPASSTNSHILQLEGASFFTIDGLHIKSLNATYGRGIYVSDDARNVTLRNNFIEVSKTATSSTTFPIIIGGENWLLDGSESRNITVSDNTVMGGYSGIQFSGIHWSQAIQNSSITGNNVQDFYGYGIYLSYTANVTVRDNTISRPTRTNTGSDSQTPAGIIVPAGSAGFVLDKNRISDLAVALDSTERLSIARGIYISGTTIAPTSGVVSNNLIYGFTNTGSQYGIQNNSAVGPIDILHNTVALNDTNGTSPSSSYNTAALYMSNTSAQNGTTVRNNIFYVTRGGASSKRLIDMSSNSPIVSNNNVFYIDTTAGLVGRVGLGAGAATYTSLADWQTGTGRDSASVFADPGFTNPATGDFMPTASVVNNIGTNVGITEDILGNLRNGTNPDAGAYEFGLCNPPAAPASITGNAAVCENATAVSYTAATVAGATSYAWTVPTGAAIASGQGTATITVNFGSTAGNVSVAAQDSCGTSTATTLAITINSTPGTPTVINGDNSVCAGANDVAYSTSAVAGATSYTWTAPTGATVSGQGASVTIDFGSTSGNITVKANNSCGSGSAVALSVTVSAAPTATLSLPLDTACLVDMPLTLTGGSPAGGTYSGTDVSGNELDASGAGLYAITYTVQDTAGCSGSATDNIVVDVCGGIGTPELAEITVYPNPFSTFTTAYLNTGNKPVRVVLYDAVGKAVMQYQPNNSQVVINRENLPAGTYTLIVEDAGKPVARKKLMIQ